MHFKNQHFGIFADTKIIKMIHSPTDHANLQLDLQNFADWCKLWQLNLSVSKCAFQSFGYKKFS